MLDIQSKPGPDAGNADLQHFEELDLRSKGRRCRMRAGQQVQLGIGFLIVFSESRTAQSRRSLEGWPGVSLATALCAMLARLTGSLMGLSWWTVYVLTPFRLDGLALGAFLAVMARQQEGLKRLVRSLLPVVVVVGSLLAITYLGPRLLSHEAPQLVMPVRAALFQVLLACLLVWAFVAPKFSATSRFFAAAG